MIEKVLIFNYSGWNQIVSSLIEGLKLNKNLQLFSTTKSNYGSDIVINSPRHYSVYPIGTNSMWVQSFVMGEEEYAIECRQLMDECDLIIIFNHNDTESSAHFRICDENILSQELINHYTEQGYTLKHEGEILTYLHLEALQSFKNKVVMINPSDFYPGTLPSGWQSVRYGDYVGAHPIYSQVYFKREKSLDIDWPDNVHPMPFSAEERYFTGGKNFNKIWNNKKINVSCLFRTDCHADRPAVKEAVIKKYENDELCVVDGVFGRKRDDGLDEQLEGVDTGNCVRHHHFYFDILSDAKINIEGPVGNTAFYTGRMMESLANGCCYFYPTPNYNVDFPNGLVDGEDFVIYHSPDDLLDKIEYYLSHEEEMKAIAENGFNKLLKYHTSEVRAKKFIEVCESYIDD